MAGLVLLLMNLNKTASEKSALSEHTESSELDVSSSVDLPAVLQGEKEKLEASFVIKNPTKKNLPDIRVQMVSCSCAKAAIDKNEILPGGQAILKLNWDVGPKVGSVRQSCSLFSD